MSNTIGALSVGVVLGLVLVLGVPGVYRAWQHRQHNALGYQRAWYWLASRTGLTFEPGQYFASPRLVGRYRGRPLTLNLLVEEGTPARTFTRLHLGLKPGLPAGRLSLARRTGLAALWPRRESEAFLRRFTLAAEPVTLGLALLASAGVKRKLLEAQAVEIDLRPDGLRLLAPGILEDPEYLAYLFNLLSDVARLVEGAHAGAPAPGDPASPTRTLAEA